MTAAVNKTTTPERRKYVRIPVKQILNYEKFTARSLSIGNIEKKVETITRNMSAGGLLFETDEKFKLGTLLKLEMKVPGWEKFKAEFYKKDKTSRSGLVVILASVVRVEIIQPETKFDIGVCFVGIDKGHQGALSKYIKKEIK